MIVTREVRVTVCDRCNTDIIDEQKRDMVEVRIKVVQKRRDAEAYAEFGDNGMHRETQRHLDGMAKMLHLHWGCAYDVADGEQHGADNVMRMAGRETLLALFSREGSRE